MADNLRFINTYLLTYSSNFPPYFHHILHHTFCLPISTTFLSYFGPIRFFWEQRKKLEVEMLFLNTGTTSKCQIVLLICIV